VPLEEKIRRFLNRHPFVVPDISLDDLERDCRAYEDGDWDSAYRIATTHVDEGWSNPPNLRKVIDGLYVLLRIWNQQFYGPSSFDEPALSQWLERNWMTIDGFRNRSISSLSEQDHEAIALTFGKLLHELRRASDGKQSPVSVAKALHLLAPKFFPIWDNAIAQGWQCRFASQPEVAYIVFCQRMRECAERLSGKLAAERAPRRDSLAQKTLLKRIDEYNYMNRT
jgi:hypothetical protein